MTTRSMLAAFTFGAVALVLGTAVEPARAHEVETGTVPVCDTQKQVERFVAVFQGNPQAAISAVNAEEQNPTACAVVNVAYISGPEIGTVRSATEAFQIIPIIVVGVSTPAGLQTIAPATCFTLLKIKEYAV
jgi:hypothetical protein